VLLLYLFWPLTVPLNWLLDQYLLQEGALVWLGPEYADYDLKFLSFIMFIATIATMVQLVEIVVENFHLHYTIL
jgi:Na+-transporting NADH:ubiquinone oxidoreductase subunit E